MKDALYAAREDELGLSWKGVYLYTANLYTTATIPPTSKHGLHSRSVQKGARVTSRKQAVHRRLMVGHPTSFQHGMTRHNDARGLAVVKLEVPPSSTFPMNAILV